MNREIKFRIWDTVLKTMCYPDKYVIDSNCFGVTNEHYIDDSTSFLPIKEDNWVLMQYTGVKDVNGYDIYEGDIISGINLEGQIEIVTVKWDTVQWYPFAGHRAIDKPKVIGNIYENPELINNE